jgi:hypothetical protein
LLQTILTDPVASSKLGGRNAAKPRDQTPPVHGTISVKSITSQISIDPPPMQVQAWPVVQKIGPPQYLHLKGHDMTKLFVTLIAASAFLAGCEEVPAPAAAPDEIIMLDGEAAPEAEDIIVIN